LVELAEVVVADGQVEARAVVVRVVLERPPVLADRVGEAALVVEFDAAVEGRVERGVGPAAGGQEEEGGALHSPGGSLS
jgi:hypothetical protein